MNFNNQLTFSLQNELPSMPVPDLSHALYRYLDSVRAVVNDDEYQRVELIVKQFALNKQTKQLYLELIEKSKHEKNWLESFWEEGAYLKLRYPILPYVNFGGISPHFGVNEWPPLEGSAIPRAALLMHSLLSFWHDQIYEENLPIQYVRSQSNKAPLCMNQFHRLFSTCRIPENGQDRLEFYFKTRREEQDSHEQSTCPKHFVVIYAGYYWKVDALDRTTEKLLTPPELEVIFRFIEKTSSTTSPSVAVGSLTTLDRDKWASARQHLLSLDKCNHFALETIQSAIVILSFTNLTPRDENELAWLSLSGGDTRDQWADKNFVWYVHRNGLLCSNSEHTPGEATVQLTCSYFIDEMLAKTKYKWSLNTDNETITADVVNENELLLLVEPLNFVVDRNIMDLIETAVTSHQQAIEQLHVLILNYNSFGFEWFRKYRLYGDTVVQMAAQLAYQKLHKKPAPTYETAHLRRYYHGRTETMRSCTKELVAWTHEMTSTNGEGGKIDDDLEKKGLLFLKAYQRHNVLMEEAQTAQGCDRILLALRMLAASKGFAEDDIFKDPSWVKSGGDGNFILSSSFVGYFNVYGGATPMCENGYGFFYKINRNHITVFLNSWKISTETNLEKFYQCFIWAFDQIKVLVERVAPSLNNSDLAKL